MPDVVSPEGASYGKYTQDHSFQGSTGLVVAPSANRAGTARLMRTGAAYGVRVVEFDESRAGAPPLVPAAADTPNDRLVSHTLHVPLPVWDQVSGRLNFRATGRYEYLQTVVRVPGVDVFPTGNYPYPLAPLDRLAALDIGSLTGFVTTGDLLVDVISALGDALDVTRPYTWNFTGLPADTFTTLISG